MWQSCRVELWWHWGLDGTPGEHPVPPLPIAGWPLQVAQACVQLGLNISEVRDFTNSLDSLFHCQTICAGKKSTSSLDVISCLLYCPGHHCKICLLCSHHLRSHCLYTVIRSPTPRLLYSRLDRPLSLSLSAYERCSSPSSSRHLCWTHSSMSFCTAESSTGHSTPDMSHWHWVERSDHLPLCVGNTVKWRPGCCWIHLLRSTLLPSDQLSAAHQDHPDSVPVTQGLYFAILLSSALGLNKLPCLK